MAVALLTNSVVQRLKALKFAKAFRQVVFFTEPLFIAAINARTGFRKDFIHSLLVNLSLSEVTWRGLTLTGDFVVNGGSVVR